MDAYSARQIARELYSLMKQDNPYAGEELLSPASLCKRLDVSRSWIATRAQELPRIKIGGSYRYPLTKVIEYLINTNNATTL